MLGKTFKGLTDEMLAWQTERLQQLEIGRDAYTVHVRPELVVEIAFNEIQESPTYSGRARPALRPRPAVPDRQVGRRGRYDRGRSGPGDLVESPGCARSRRQ